MLFLEELRQKKAFQQEKPEAQQQKINELQKQVNWLKKQVWLIKKECRKHGIDDIVNPRSKARTDHGDRQ